MKTWGCSLWIQEKVLTIPPWIPFNVHEVISMPKLQIAEIREILKSLKMQLKEGEFSCLIESNLRRNWKSLKHQVLGCESWNFVVELNNLHQPTANRSNMANWTSKRKKCTAHFSPSHSDRKITICPTFRLHPKTRRKNWVRKVSPCARWESFARTHSPCYRVSKLVQLFLLWFECHAKLRFKATLHNEEARKNCRVYSSSG